MANIAHQICSIRESGNLLVWHGGHPALAFTPDPPWSPLATMHITTPQKLPTSCKLHSLTAVLYTAIELS